MSKRLGALVILLIAVIAAAWLYSTRRAHPSLSQITVYYTKSDGTTEVPWVVSMRPQMAGESAAEHLRNTVVYAATQAIAGPPSDVQAVRFPSGTHLLGAQVQGSTAIVDISGEVKTQSGTYGESGEFKSLVWTLTALPGINGVLVKVDGQTLATLPGGQLELDAPLHRSDW